MITPCENGCDTPALFEQCLFGEPIIPDRYDLFCAILSCEGRDGPDHEIAAECAVSWRGLYESVRSDEREPCQAYSDAIDALIDCVLEELTCERVSNDEFWRCGEEIEPFDELEAAADDIGCGLPEDEWPELEDSWAKVVFDSMVACALRDSGELSCWAMEEDNEVLAVPEGSYIDVAVDWNTACALDQDGHVVCWGPERSRRVTDAPEEGVFVALFAGPRSYCAQRPDGTVLCWGNFEEEPRPEGVVEEVSSSQTNTCFLYEDGSVDCFRFNHDDRVWYEEEVPAGVYRAVYARQGYTCAVTLDDRPVCWGDRVPLAGLDLEDPRLVRELAAGTMHLCVLYQDDSFDCGGTWRMYADAPEEQYRNMTANWTTTCGITYEEELLCWGEGEWFLTGVPEL